MYCAKASSKGHVCTQKKGHIDAHAATNSKSGYVYEVWSNDPDADPTNPKDLIGAKKVSHTALPAIAILQGNRAMMDGATKYGGYNWREKKIQSGIYIDAALRHINSWYDGEETAEDSGVHHLGHAIACLGIILDAQANDSMVDTRPPKGGGYLKELKRLNSELSK